MLNIQTFDNRSGGNVTYKALAHPLAAEAIAALYAGLRRRLRSTTPTRSPIPCWRFIPACPGWRHCSCTTSPRSASAAPAWRRAR